MVVLFFPTTGGNSFSASSSLLQRMSELRSDEAHILVDSIGEGEGEACKGPWFLSLHVKLSDPLCTSKGENLFLKLAGQQYM